MQVPTTHHIISTLRMIFGYLNNHKHLDLWNCLFLQVTTVYHIIYRGLYMSAHALLNLVNDLRKRDKMLRLLSILSLFRNELNKFNNTGA